MDQNQPPIVGKKSPPAVKQPTAKQNTLPRWSGLDPNQQPPRKKRTFKRNQLFGLKLSDDLEIEGYADSTEHTPDTIEGYIFPADETRVVLMGLENRDRILAVGHTGSGKTSLFEQIANRLNMNVVKIGFDAHIGRGDLLGEWVVRGGDMVFQYGLLPMAMRMPGTMIILDEWDTINEDTSFVLQRVLQKEDGKLVLLENSGEIVRLHPDNVIVATANTCGQGDETGLYTHGTRVQNYAQLNRFGLTIRLDYLKPELEEKMLIAKFTDLKKHEAEAFVKMINKVRDGFANNQLSVPLSTRDLLNWVEKYLIIGNPMVAATYCFLNRMTREDAEVCKGIIQRVFEEMS